jgi:acyl-CoA thioester hydrolase
MRGDPARGALATYPFTLSLDTRFGDMDPNRHLNNTAISRLYEEARVRFHMMIRAAHTEIGHPRFLVGRIEIDYLAEGHYPAKVELGLGVISVGTRSYRVGSALFQNDACIGLSEAVIVHRAETGTGPIPDVLRGVLERYRLKLGTGSQPD